MPKHIPPCPEIPKVVHSDLEERTYKIQIITPLFGGGVEAGVIDNHWPIRESSIRGHLRHWWRMIIGHKLGDKMWQREEEIFGSTEFPSPLTVRVLGQPRIEEIDLSSFGGRSSPIAYAVFSAIENNQAIAKDGLKFKLQLSWEKENDLKNRRTAQNMQRKRDRKKPLSESIEDISKDIQTAVRAWVNFGGLGARTRRGCGALYCDTATEMPQLSGKIFIGDAKQTAMKAWEEAVRVYRDFRQSPRGPKHSKTINTKNGPVTRQVPGRTYWPEADSIRHITGCSLKPPPGFLPSEASPDQNPHDHSTPVVPKELLPAFPRAVLGLPINFHFADSPGKNRQGQFDKDPQDVQLVPLLPKPSGTLEEAERMASPIITRPLWVKDKWHPAVIILDQLLQKGFQVRLKGKKANKNGGDLSRDLPMGHVVDAKLSVANPMRGKSSAIEALTEYLTKERHFQEVAR